MNLSKLIKDPQTGLYPEIEPRLMARLKPDEVHSLYFEESGNPDGIPVIFIHGGPGGGTSGTDRRYFNPEKYRIILLDQRGAGQSLPSASLENNTTWHLVSDLELLRQSLKIKKWLVFGGSWGSTLALTYAIQHPEHVLGLVLRGIFLLRKCEIDWYYQKGADFIFPDVFEEYQSLIPESEREDYVKAYYSRLTSPDLETQKRFARTWTKWEMATSRLYTPPELITQAVTDDFSLKFARIECHYFKNAGFFEKDGWILDQIDRIRSIPTIIVQGRYDVVCPMRSAYDLSQRFPEAELQIIPESGHSAREPHTSRALVAACDRFAERLTRN